MPFFTLSSHFKQNYPYVFYCFSINNLSFIYIYMIPFFFYYLISAEISLNLGCMDVSMSSKRIAS